MPGLIAFLNGAVALIATGVGAYSAGALCYGAFHWYQGDHERGKKHIFGSVLGAGIILTCALLGASIAAIAHGG